MKVKTHVRAGGIRLDNHNETIVRDKGKGEGLKVKTKVTAGLQGLNHNETLMKAAPTGLKVKTKVKAGILTYNHNEMLVRDRRRKR